MAITFTALAAKEVAKIMADQNLDQKTHYIRVGVKGGGCSGYKFSMDIVNSKTDDEEEWEYDGVKVLCDSRSFIYLNGTTIDFKDELMGQGFVFENPNATSRCGCGSSFSV